jgi:hypothetical protein
MDGETHVPLQPGRETEWQTEGWRVLKVGKWKWEKRRKVRQFRGGRRDVAGEMMVLARCW